MSNNKTLAEKIVDSAGTGKADPVALALLSDITASAAEINKLDGVGGATTDAEARTAINAIIDALEAFGISATS